MPETTSTFNLFTSEEIKQAQGHNQLHKMGLCICPCNDILLKLAENFEAMITAAKLEGVQATFKAISKQDE